MELAGISMAAIMGFKLPLTAKLKPTTLYNMLIKKLHQITRLPRFTIRHSESNVDNELPMIIASQPGEK
jgi:hypothetical protein